MADYTELKRLAEACTIGEWYLAGELRYEDRRSGDLHGLHHDDERFIAAANPTAVLALIAENERVKARLCVCRDCGGQGEIYSGRHADQGYYQPPEPVMHVCGTCDGDGVLGALEDFEALAAERDELRAAISTPELVFVNMKAGRIAKISLRSAIDLHGEVINGDDAQQIEIARLRAEVAGLKTGYQAYEQVNAELKAENEALLDGANFRAIQSLRQDCEALRKALGECAGSLHGEMLQKFGGQLPEDMHPVTRRDYGRDMAELAGYRAAIGKGEQS